MQVGRLLMRAEGRGSSVEQFFENEGIITAQAVKRKLFPVPTYISALLLNFMCVIPFCFIPW